MLLLLKLHLLELSVQRIRQAVHFLVRSAVQFVPPFHIGIIEEKYICSLCVILSIDELVGPRPEIVPCRNRQFFGLHILLLCICQKRSILARIMMVKESFKKPAIELKCCGTLAIYLINTVKKLMEHWRSF